ncbi:MAG TPA: hypothetical protein VEG39_09520 [Clostridia bacterium]|nr:hypothetical protein [Clostridia bacterium]
MENKLVFIESGLSEISLILASHKSHLAYPIDSYGEDKLYESIIYRIIHDGIDIGYAGIIQDSLRFFHVLPAYFRYAPEAFEYCINQKEIKRVNVLTQDPLLVSLISEWDFRIEKEGCDFIDSGRLEKPLVEAGRAKFRAACAADIPAIVKGTGDFFDRI